MSKKIFLLIALFTYFLTNINYHFGDDNHLEHLPFIYSRLDQTYLPHDFFTQYTKQIGPRYYYANLLASLGQYIPLEYLFYTLTYLCNLGIYLITYHLLKKFTTHPWAIFFLMLFMGHAQFANLGQSAHINDNYLTPQLLAMPLILLSYASALEGRYVTSLASSLLVIPLHPSLALVSTLPIIANLALTLKKHRLVLLPLFILSQLTLTYSLFLRHKASVLSTDQYLYILATLRHPHHYLPSHFSLTDYLTFIVLLFFLCTALHYLRSHRPKSLFFVCLTIAITLLLCLAGLVFSEIIPIRPIIELQPFRVIYLTRYLGFIVIIAAAFEFTKHRLTWSQSLLLWGLLSYLIIVFWPGKAIYLISNPSLKLEPDRQNLYTYITAHTPSDAIFLSPPDFASMRLLPRSIVVDWKAFPFTETAMKDWYQRITDLYGQGNLNQNYQNLTSSDIIVLSDKYQADYAILYSQTPTNLLVVYHDSLYKLVKLEKKPLARPKN